MRFFLIPAAALAILAAPAAQAGCLTGAAVGGVVGHMAGHHGAVGAGAGCVAGHEHSKHVAARRASDQQSSSGTQQPAGNSNGNTQQ